MAELIRDHILEDALLKAVIADQNERPRSQQMQIGPSEIGGCRELVRAKIFEDRSTFLPDTHWHTAAHVGTVMGEDLERIFGERLGAETQRRITAYLDTIGISVSGAVDLMFVRNGVIVDLKGTGAFGSVQYEGGVKLDYYIQISLYVYGAVQLGILQEGASGRIVYYDRVGGEQTFIAVVVPWETVLNYVELAQRRLQEILNAQAGIEAGQPHMAHHLRDQVPSYCFSEKVQCPRRLACWGGSDWAPMQYIDDPEIRRASIEYIAGRKLENRGKAMKEQARGLLKGVEGAIVGGGMVGWKNGRISVVELDVLPEVQAKVDEISGEWAKEPVAPAVRPEPTEPPSEESAGPSTTAPSEGPDSPGESMLHVGGPMDGSEGFDADELPETVVTVEPDEGAYLRPDEHEKQALLDGPTPPEVVLEQNRDLLTPAQVAYLERKAEEMREPTAEEARPGRHRIIHPATKQHALCTCDSEVDHGPMEEVKLSSEERLAKLQKSVAADRKRRANEA
jgi:hypothetical protein